MNSFTGTCKAQENVHPIERKIVDVQTTSKLREDTNHTKIKITSVIKHLL